MVDRIIRIRVETGGAVGSTSRLGGALGKLNQIALAVGTTTAALTAAIVKQADQWNRLTTQLKTVTASEEELADVQAKLVTLANETNSTLDGTVNLYARLARATEGAAISQEELLEVTGAINQAFVLSGATATEAENAIIQLSQGLAAGVFRGEEFNSVAEQGPRLLKALSDALGVTQGELRNLANEGQLTSSVVIQAFKEQASVIESEFGNVIPTVDAQLTILGNKFTQVAGAANTAFGDVFGKTLTDTVIAELEKVGFLLDDILVLIDKITGETVSRNAEDAQKRFNDAKAEELRLLQLEFEQRKKIREIVEGGGTPGFVDLNALENTTLKLNEVRKEILAAAGDVKRLGEVIDRRSGVDTGAGDDTGGDDVNPGPGLASDILNSQIEANRKILSDARARRLQEQQEGRQERLDDLRAGGQEEIQAIRDQLSIEEQIRSGALTQEQAQLQQRLEAALEAARVRAQKEQELQREINAAAFEQEQSEREKAFLERLNDESLQDEDRAAIIAERNAARLEELRAFEEEQRSIIISSLEDEQAIRNAFADEQIRLEQEKQKALRLANLDAASDILTSISQFGENSIRIQKGVALAQAGISIATGIARAQELGFPANIAEAARVAAVGVNAVRSIQSAKKGSAGNISAGGVSSSAASTPSQASDAAAIQRSSGIENTQINALREELANRDPSEQISIEFTRRIVDSIIQGQVDGTIEEF